MQSRLEQHGVVIRPEGVAALEGENEGHLQRICFTDGQLWKGPRCFSQRAARSAQTCGNGSRAKRDEKGGIINDPRSEESSVPGVYVAGDASRDVLLVAVTIAEGAKAAVAINRSFLKEDVLGWDTLPFKGKPTTNR
jgi:thioredoxin reductase